MGRPVLPEREEARMSRIYRIRSETQRATTMGDATRKIKAREEWRTPGKCSLRVPYERQVL